MVKGPGAGSDQARSTLHALGSDPANGLSNANEVTPTAPTKADTELLQPIVADGDGGSERNNAGLPSMLPDLSTHQPYTPVHALQQQSQKILSQQLSPHQLTHVAQTPCVVVVDETPAAQSLKERKIREQFAQEEARIYKLYRDYTQNDLKREKKNSLVTLKYVKMEGNVVFEELQAIRDENAHLRKTIKRYQQLV